MNSEEFRQFGKAMVDYIAEYWDTIRDRDALPSVQPHYLEKLIPSEAPLKGENWREVLDDIDRVIMPGITHWNSPNFHAYFPAGNSFPGVVGEMLCAGLGCIGFSWLSSPACTELEVAMMNWLGKLLGLPEVFLNCSDGPGGGVLQGSASESTLITLLAAKEKTVSLYKSKFPEMSEAEIKGKLVAYTSDQANSSVERAGMLASVPMKLLDSESGKLQGETLRKAILKDKKAGLIPCYVVATLGTSGTCAFDDLEELGLVCQEDDIWIHVDAAYAGAAFICSEFRHYMKGLELCESFTFNPHKWMLTQFDCSTLWLKNATYLIEAFNVDRIYLQHQHEDASLDYRHWQIPLGRRFRALKVWFVLRIYGIEGIQNYIRKDVALANYFKNLVLNDPRFEISTYAMGVVCFRLEGDDGLTQKLLDKITENKKLYLIPCTFNGKYALRFVVVSRLTETSDIDSSWSEILEHANQIVPSNTIYDLPYSILKEPKQCKLDERINRNC